MYNVTTGGPMSDLLADGQLDGQFTDDWIVKWAGKRAVEWWMDSGQTGGRTMQDLCSE